jgi:hypothetical protein
LRVTTLAAVLLLAAVAQAKDVPTTVSIYVGPQVRDGFVDVDQGVRDSIKDIREALREQRWECPSGKRPLFPWSSCGDTQFRVVNDEAAAELRLYVVKRTREVGPTRTGGVIIKGTGTVTSAPTNIYRLETLLRAGTYEREFAAEHDRRRGLAQRIGKDVSAWLAANRERVLTKEP